METHNISKKLVSGFVSLVARKAMLDAISFVTIFIVLAKILPVETIGIFSIASGILAFFTYFSDFGLSASLIQKKQISEIDLKTAFFVQEILALLILITVWIFAPTFAIFFGLDIAGMWLVRALGIGFFLTTLKVIPSIMLERELRFKPLVLVDVIEALTFNALLIYLVYEGFGVYGFAWATIFRSVAGVLAIYLVSPWKVSLGVSKESAKTLLNFGVPFQLNSILALLKDRLTPLITASIIGPVGTGYVSWSQGIAYRPLEVMSIVIRVTFPAFSRLQDNREELKKIIEKSLLLTALFLYPLLFGLLAVAPSFVEFMGKEKFAPALPLIYLFAISTFWAAPSTTFTNVLNATGRVGVTLKLMIMWTILTWGLSPLFAYFYGYIGVAIAAAVISFTSIIPIVIVVRMYGVNLIRTLWKPLLSSVAMAVFVYLLTLFFASNIYTLIVTIVLGAFVYLGLIFLMAKDVFLEEVRKLIKNA